METANSLWKAVGAPTRFLERNRTGKVPVLPCLSCQTREARMSFLVLGPQDGQRRRWMYSVSFVLPPLFAATAAVPPLVAWARSVLEAALGM